MTEEPACPQLDKMHDVHDKSQAIGEFLDWLEDNTDFRICRMEQEHAEGTAWIPNTWYPTHYDIQRLLAQFFDIDFDEAERERQRLLDFVRAQQEARL